MTAYKPGETISAKFLRKCLNCRPVLTWTRFCLHVARTLRLEAGFEVTAQFRGQIIGISPIIIGGPATIHMHEVVLRTIDTFWHIREARSARKPRTSLMPLLTIHTFLPAKNDKLIFVPSRDDLGEMLRYDRSKTLKDHQVSGRSLCIELRPYTDGRTRFFIVQEKKPHGISSVNRAVTAAVRAATVKKRRSAVIRSMDDHGYNLQYGFFGRQGFVLNEDDLTKFEFSIDFYHGK